MFQIVNGLFQTAYNAPSLALTTISSVLFFFVSGLVKYYVSTHPECARAGIKLGQIRGNNQRR